MTHRLKKGKWFVAAATLMGLLIVSTGNQSANCAVSFPDGTKFVAEVADSPAARQQGLSNRDNLDANSGMLFLFPTNGVYPFWMKDTRLPLDIIWLNNHAIVEIASLGPLQNGTIPTHTPRNSANAVLEINQGQAQAHQLKPGDRLEWHGC